MLVQAITESLKNVRDVIKMFERDCCIDSKEAYKQLEAFIAKCENIILRGKNSEL